ncbi:MAG: hypothetical protein LC797_12990 [Chloroflexi bacterium]|nr:hypothetical protein [Chloroflexota bacterium]
MQAQLAQDDVAVQNAQRSLDDANASLAAAQNSADQANLSDGVSVHNAQQNLGSARTALSALSAAQQQITAATQADQVAVQNAQRALANAQTAVNNAQNVASASDNVASKQVSQAQSSATSTGASVNTAQAQQSLTQAQNVQSLANAQANVTIAQNAFNTAQAAVETDQAKNQASLVSAQAQVTTAEDALKTAQAAQQSDAANQEQSLVSAQGQVNGAQNSLNTARAALTSDQATNQQGLESAKATVHQALNSVLTAQDSLASDQVKQLASIQTAQNSVDQAQSALDKSNASLQNTIAQQNATLQSAQNTMAQSGSALQTQQATFASSTAGPTQADLVTANAQVSGPQATLQTAQNNLAAAVLTAPTGGTIASVNRAVGQYTAVDRLAPPPAAPRAVHSSRGATSAQRKSMRRPAKRTWATSNPARSSASRSRPIRTALLGHRCRCFIGHQQDEHVDGYAQHPQHRRGRRRTADCAARRLMNNTTPLTIGSSGTITITGRHQLMETVQSFQRFVASGIVVLGLGAAALTPGLAMAQDDPRVFTDTGYTIADDSIWSFFNQYGGVSTFGEPISREFTLIGKPIQLFQNAALQVQPDGSVQAMQLTAPGLVAATQLDGLTVPASDAALAFVTPSPDQPNYSARVQIFLLSVVPDFWNGQPVQFLSTFNSEGGTAVLGMPTSSPKADPGNPSFVYQRFQNGILFYDASAATTTPLPLGNFLKSLITSGKLSADSSDAFVPDA